MDNREIMVGISLICYNHAPFLRKCLDSILMQKVNFRYQVVVGEDCSTDNSREILREYEEKYPDIFVMLYNEKNLGPSGNSLNVKRHLTGKYIVGGETDDFWTDENRLQKQFDFLESHPEYVAVGSNFYSVDAEGKQGRMELFDYQVNKPYELKDYLLYGYVIHGNTLMYRNVIPFQSEKYLKMRSVATTMGDIITRVLLYDKGRIFILPDIMHAHRSGAKTPSSFSCSYQTRALEYTKMYCCIVDAIEEYCDGKYDLYELKANRTAALMEMKYLSKCKIDSVEYKNYFQSLPKKICRKAKMRFIQKIARKIWRKILRKIIKKYKTHEIELEGE